MHEERGASEIARHVIQQMCVSLDSHSSISRLAREAGLTVPELAAKCCQMTGLPPSRLRSYLRIQKAKEMLIDTAESVTNIALDVGYDSLGTFVRRFTSLVGLTPTDLRKLCCKVSPGEVLDVALNGGFDSRYVYARNGQFVSGVVTASVRGDACFSVIGLFAKAAPAGVPYAGCVLLDCGRFRLARPSGVKECHLLAMQVPQSLDERSLWLPSFANMRIAHHKVPIAKSGPVQRDISVTFRTRNRFDPPVLIPLPVLLGLQRDPADRKGYRWRSRSSASG